MSYNWPNRGISHALKRTAGLRVGGAGTMKGRKNGRSHYECVIVDLNTQFDFCDCNGIQPVNNSHELHRAMRHMVAWSKRNQVPIISSIESHRKCDFTEYAHTVYCLDGSTGQQKIDFTILDNHASVEVDNTLCCPVELFQRYQQVIFRQRSDDLLANPKADRFFTQMPTDEFIVFGVSLEGAVKALALGLLARNKKVIIVPDACGYWNPVAADLSVRQLIAKGASITSVDELLTRKLSRTFRYSSTRSLGHTSQHNGRNRNGQSEKANNGQGQQTQETGENGRSRHKDTQRSHPMTDNLPLPDQDTSITRRNGRPSTES